MDKDNSKTFLLVLLGLLTAFGPFVTDMYLPALPAMADDNINFTLSVEPSSLTAPGPVTVSVRVVNAGNKSIVTGNVVEL